MHSSCMGGLFCVCVSAIEASKFFNVAFLKTGRRSCVIYKIWKFYNIMLQSLHVLLESISEEYFIQEGVQ